MAGHRRPPPPPPGDGDENPPLPPLRQPPNHPAETSHITSHPTSTHKLQAGAPALPPRSTNPKKTVAESVQEQEDDKDDYEDMLPPSISKPQLQFYKGKQFKTIRPARDAEDEEDQYEVPLNSTAPLDPLVQRDNQDDQYGSDDWSDSEWTDGYVVSNNSCDHKHPSYTDDDTRPSLPPPRKNPESNTDHNSNNTGNNVIQVTVMTSGPLPDKNKKSQEKMKKKTGPSAANKPVPPPKPKISITNPCSPFTKSPRPNIFCPEKPLPDLPHLPSKTPDQRSGHVKSILDHLSTVPGFLDTVHAAPEVMQKCQTTPTTKSNMMDIPVRSIPDQEIYSDGVSEVLSELPWYHGNITRQVGNDKINTIHQNGAFLVRSSKNSPYVLMVWLDNRVHNLKIRERVYDKQFAIGKEKPDEVAFPTLPDLVNYHKVHCVTVLEVGTVMLRKTPPKL